MKRLWVTGYRAYELSVFQDDDPKVKVIKSVLKNSFEARLNMSDEEFWLISGPQMGVERWAIEVATELKTTYPQLKTSIIEPYQAVAQRWNEQNQAKLLETLAKVDFHAAVSNQPYQSPQQLRDYQRFMLEHSDQLLMIFDVDRESDSEQHSKPSWDYRAAQRYQTQYDYQIQLINFDDLQEAATEIAEQEEPDY
ncbi:DUF1273 domain-containing protein [Limosilactobacillus caecicola]|uniref:DUF1273 domain-containing protein n=1 Tax=Limosilactobacillus caecicola TaxID=2941332 RepID=UPI00204055AB|nr:DUF1273 domain-containing protein [Limosilactobacillus caecicola]